MNKVFPWIRIVSLMMVILVLAACRIQVTPATPTPEISQPIYRWGEVADRVWVLVAYGDALNPTVVEEGPVVTAVFSSVEPTVSGSGGCNNYAAAYTSDDDGNLTINGPIAATMMFCETGADQETTYFNALETVTGYSLTEEGRLELTYDSGQPYDEKLVFAPGEPVNGWRGVPHAFDYNLDNLGIGALTDWKFPDRATAFFFRAIIARVGLWGQHGYEAYYPQIFEDRQGQQLNGTYKYVIHFDELPPADAFWSITMYDMPRYRLINNPINRYSIGDRTPGLKYNVDGSLDIYIQTDSPGPDKESNWLPCPEGNFRPVMRMYQPRPEALDGTYVLPPVHRVG